MRIRWAFLGLLLASVWTLMRIPGGGEWYARHIYPVLSNGLSRFSSLFPFSVGDVFIYGSLGGLIAYAVVCLYRRKGIRRMIRREVEYLAWTYVWFYLAWGLLYYRADFFTRTSLEKQPYSKEQFDLFLTRYTDSLNASYVTNGNCTEPVVAHEVKQGYKQLAAHYGLNKPADYLRAKPMLCSTWMSGVGVLGYVGPFFTEYNLNRDLLPTQFAATYAHEMAHVLGIANEAEANFFSYKICTASSVPAIRFSGYFSLLPYVISNAHRLLSPTDFKTWKETLRPEIMTLYQEKQAYWNALYNPFIGRLQAQLYNWYLKGNRIPTGTANYSEVISLIISESML